MHEPALVTALLTNNDGNRRGDLFRGDIKTRLVRRQIAVKIPANADVTELERSCETATHQRKL
jgi:hypothetical protein